MNQEQFKTLPKPTVFEDEYLLLWKKIHLSEAEKTSYKHWLVDFSIYVYNK